jgi:phosphomannomutase
MSHRFNPTSLREYDIRGIVGETLGEADAYAVGRTFGTLLSRAGGKRAAVGRDGRTHSPSLEAELVRGFTEAGVDVVRVGLGPTPMLYYSEAELDVDGGIQITGSHNPGNYNGFKMVMFGKAFFGADIQKLGRMARRRLGGRQRQRLDEDVIDMLCRSPAPRFRRRPPTAWAGIGQRRCRPGSRAAGEAPAGRTSHALHRSATAPFPNHHPDPTVEANLETSRARRGEEARLSASPSMAMRTGSARSMARAG